MKSTHDIEAVHLISDEPDRDPLLKTGTGESDADSSVGRKMNRPPEPLSRRYLRVLAVVSLYWFVSISMVFVNKRLLSGKTDFDAPFFVTWFQCVISVIGCYGVYGLTLMFPDYIEFPRPKLNRTTCLKVLPLSVVFCAMIGFNNLCLQSVGVSFYYVGRSLTTVFNVICTFLILGQKTSMNAVISCGVIVFGFWLGVDQEGALGSLSMLGVIYGVMASLCVALFAIYIKKVLPLVDDNIWTLTLYNNVNASLLFIPLILLWGETPSILGSPEVVRFSFWFDMMVGGVLGLAIGSVTGLQVKVTSPLTHNISGTAKAAAQTLLATQINAEIKSLWWWVSNAVVLIGTLMYTRVKQLEMAKK
ncbi:hypothetical protein TCAL_04223 [Tigriopus californicus]|uniref:Sugar phosphate transporter domain-containing protein n=2 Tax=Tigriopus californicus TaxID=6832 RepID=A0A553PMK0_TIGCA|nr:hypothetical protein TCAL_04223 [Tigriopus californicus]|eukprot:TCALIF_04223-PA protein Name:"Similar to slc35c1 GDP-fucose transporter 1 (Nematostella vectensis)" AED:0.02 eAED:0.02 QI:0/-1/0/1/-1/1/1/0/360